MYMFFVFHYNESYIEYDYDQQVQETNSKKFQ